MSEDNISARGDVLQAVSSGSEGCRPMELRNTAKNLMKYADLAKMLVDRSYRKAPPGKPFVLASGATSEYYFECQRTTWYSPAFRLIGEAFLDTFRELGVSPSAAGGLKSGADTIAFAVSLQSTYSGWGGPEIHAFSVRKERKVHGAQRRVEGCVESGEAVAIVDDVVTSGRSVVQAIRTCQEEGLRIAAVVVLVDREEQSGMDIIRAAVPDVPVTAIFSWSDLKPLIEEQHGTAPHP
jgi:orotate phosphoribosyltransferase